jgi:hypothetical protein
MRLRAANMLHDGSGWCIGQLEFVLLYTGRHTVLRPPRLVIDKLHSLGAC